MKVRDLLQALSQADPDDDVCVFTDAGSGAQTVNDVGVWQGKYDRILQSNAFHRETLEGQFVGLMNPGDYERSCEDFGLVNDLTL